MNAKEFFYPESRFGGFTNIDGSVAFYTRVNELLKPASTVLDIGCGRGEYSEDPVMVRRNLRIFKGRCQKVIGLDVDGAGRQNPYLDEFQLLQDSKWPLPNASIDLAVGDFVMEHVTDPESFLSEASRVIRPGGHLCLRTTNAWGYVAFAATLIPNKFHARVLRKVQDNRKVEDVFPTVYRCNTKRKLRSALRRHGFDPLVFGYEAEPSYLSFSSFFYFFGVLYQKLAPNMFRNALFAFARKS